MLHPVMAASFENVEEAHNVAFRVEPGVAERMTHTGLGCQVNDEVGAVFFKDAGDYGLIGDVCPVHRESRHICEEAKAGLLECRVIIVIEVVQTMHDLTIVQKAPYDVKADEAGGARDENHAI